MDGWMDGWMDRYALRSQVKRAHESPAVLCPKTKVQDPALVIVRPVSHLLGKLRQVWPCADKENKLVAMKVIRHQDGQ